jgi:hypothetical protein
VQYTRISKKKAGRVISRNLLITLKLNTMSNTASDSLTLKEARDLMRPLLKKGVACLCCHQLSKLYVRKMTSAMVYGLILLYKEVKDKPDPEHHYIHLENFFKKLDIPSSIRGDAPKLRFWGLIETMDGNKEDGNPSTGFYRLTKEGISFVLGRSLVSKSIRIYNNTFYGYEGPEIDIHVAIKGKFNYTELMGG